jgi:hypothetical protein
MAREYPGDETIDALLTTGWNITIDAEGSITADRNQTIVTGTVNADGSITWGTDVQTLGILREARIRQLQAKADQAKRDRAAKPA